MGRVQELDRQKRILSFFSSSRLPRPSYPVVPPVFVECRDHLPHMHTGRPEVENEETLALWVCIGVVSAR